MSLSLFDERVPLLLYFELNGDDGPGATSDQGGPIDVAYRVDRLIVVSADPSDQVLRWSYVDPINNERDIRRVLAPAVSDLDHDKIDIISAIKPPGSDGLILPPNWRVRVITDTGITAGARIMIFGFGGTLPT